MLSKRILIVGSGPVGLAAALFLTKSNQQVTLIQKSTQRNKYSKALLTNTRTLNLLHTINADTKIISKSNSVSGAQIYYNNQLAFKANFNDHKISAKGYYGQRLVNLPQSQVEECLQQNLKEKGIEVRRGVELVSAKNTENGKVQTVVKRDGKVNREDYDIVLGCDGARSAVRHQIHAEFQGHTVPDRVMYMSDYKLHTQFNKIGIRLFTTPQPFLIGILPVSKNVIRVISNNPHYDSLLPPELENRQQLWNTTFKINHRLSSKLREGNIFLAGDAAHVHSPLGGRGMNIGIEDVYVFSELLRQGRLDEYEEERYKVLKPLVKRIRGMSEFMMIPNKWKYSTVGVLAKNVGWMLPEKVYENMITFITGQDHEV